MGSHTDCPLLFFFFFRNFICNAGSGESFEKKFCAFPEACYLSDTLPNQEEGFMVGWSVWKCVELLSPWEAARGMRGTLPWACMSPACPDEICKVRFPPFPLPFPQGSDDLPAEYYWPAWPHIDVSYLWVLQRSCMVQVWGHLEEKRNGATVMMPVTNTQCSLWLSHPCLRFWKWATEILT